VRRGERGAEATVVSDAPEQPAPRMLVPSSEPTKARRIARSKRCPRCGDWTTRRHTPWRYRPIRWLLPGHSSFRQCRSCNWQGMAIH